MGIYIDIYPHFFRKFPFWGANLYISPSIYIPIRFDFFSTAEQNLYISPYICTYFPKFSRLRRESIYIPIYIYPHSFSIFSLQKWIYIYPHLYISPFTSVGCCPGECGPVKFIGNSLGFGRIGKSYKRLTKVLQKLRVG